MTENFVASHDAVAATRQIAFPTSVSLRRSRRCRGVQQGDARVDARDWMVRMGFGFFGGAVEFGHAMHPSPARKRPGRCFEASPIHDFTS